MNITTYNGLLTQYHAAWQVVAEFRTHVQQADRYLSAYGLQHQANGLHLHINPAAHIDTYRWPTAADILQAVSRLKDVGERLVLAFNELSLTDRYLVTIPPLR